jgi:hypothetical protein
VRAARSAHPAAPPSSVGAPAIPSPAHAAIDGTQAGAPERPLVMEPSGPARTSSVASGSLCQRATSRTAGLVPRLAGIVYSARRDADFVLSSSIQTEPFWPIP